MEAWWNGPSHIGAIGPNIQPGGGPYYSRPWNPHVKPNIKIAEKNTIAARKVLREANNTLAIRKQETAKQQDILKKFEREQQSAATRKAQLARVREAKLAVEEAQVSVGLARATFTRARDYFRLLGFEEFFIP